MVQRAVLIAEIGFLYTGNRSSVILMSFMSEWWKTAFNFTLEETNYIVDIVD